MVIKEKEKLNRNLCQAGSAVFYWEGDHGWALGKVEADSGKHFSVRGTGFSATKKAELGVTEKLADDKIWPIRDDVLEEDFHDLLDLTVLHDATIQRCLYLRYMNDVVYTNIGQIVVALNPWNFKIPYYMDAFMPNYLAEGEVIKDNRPHSWAQAHNTYFDLRRDEQHQCILISGESGAGKTEAAKIVMKYLGALSCRQGSEDEKAAARNVAFNINQASPILEGFGNAKTVRNDNSSRFGKFMKVQFSESGFLVGAYTIKYLLEKSRIVTASTNERVYHAFYLVTKGCDAQTKFSLQEPKHYHINAGSCIDIDGVDDREDYSLCVAAMHDCGFSDSQIDGVWGVVGGITHMLTLKFDKIDADSCKIKDKTPIEHACRLWHTDVEVYLPEATTTTFETRDGPVTKLLNIVKATDNRDALVKTLYDSLFGWQVETINHLTDAGEEGGAWIGLLDIFGFEDFEHNYFEQICINLANETLQNHYNTFIFSKDMDECRAEGVDVTEVTCPDNKPCLLLMTSKTGIFGLLDDECSLGQGSDAGFLQKVLDTNGGNEFLATKKMSRDSFIVHHYAASVNYTVEGWLDKNRDSLKPAMKLFMRESKQELISSLLPEPSEDVKKDTVGGFFRKQLIQLMDLINSTNPHWIRCVKPHPAKKPLMVDGITTMQQLESSGVLGTVKIRKAGFPVRPTFQKFISRFKVIVPPPHPALTEPNTKLSAFCLKVCEFCGIEKLKAQAGKTKMFLKNESNQHLESEREKALSRCMKVVKQCGYYQISLSLVAYRRRLSQFNSSADVLQTVCKSWYARSKELRAQREAERKEREKVLQAFKQKQAVAEASLKRLAETYTVPSTLRPIDDTQLASLQDRAAKMRSESATAHDIATTHVHADFDVQSRAAHETLCSKLTEMWFAKPGDILDEWTANFTANEDAGLDVLAILSELCQHLSTLPKEGDYAQQGRCALFCRALLTMEGVDIDRIMGFPEGSSVNPPLSCLIPTLMANGGSKLDKWIKTVCLTISLSQTLTTPMSFLCKKVPKGESIIYWNMVSTGSCTSGEGAVTPGDSDMSVIVNVKEAVFTKDVSQYPGVRPYVLPPLMCATTEGCAERVFTWKGSASTNVFMRELKPLCLLDARCADDRLLKVREKLQEKRLEEEREQQRLAAEAILEDLNRLEAVEERRGRMAVVTEWDESYGDIIDTFNGLINVFYGAQAEWLFEAYSGIRKTIMRSEIQERRHLLMGLLAGSVASSHASNLHSEEMARFVMCNSEVLLRAEIIARRRIEHKEMSAVRRVVDSVRSSQGRASEAVRRREIFNRKREKELAKLHRMREAELTRLMGGVVAPPRHGAALESLPAGFGAGYSNVLSPILASPATASPISDTDRMFPPSPYGTPLGGSPTAPTPGVSGGGGMAFPMRNSSMHAVQVPVQQAFSGVGGMEGGGVPSPFSSHTTGGTSPLTPVSVGGVHNPYVRGMDTSPPPSQF